MLKVTNEHIEEVVKIFSRAYINYPTMWFLFFDSNKVNFCLSQLFRYVITQRIKFGEVYTPSLNFEGIITWYHSDQSNISIFDQIRYGGFNMMRKLKLKNIKKLIKFNSFNMLLEKEQIKPPYIYLGPACVDPFYQGCGFFSSMLDFLLNKANKLFLPIYLQTHELSNVELYKNKGFK